RRCRRPSPAPLRPAAPGPLGARQGDDRTPAGPLAVLALADPVALPPARGGREDSQARAFAQPRRARAISPGGEPVGGPGGGGRRRVRAARADGGRGIARPLPGRRGLHALSRPSYLSA